MVLQLLHIKDFPNDYLPIDAVIVSTKQLKICTIANTIHELTLQNKHQQTTQNKLSTR